MRLSHLPAASLTRIDRYVLRQLLLALFAVSGGLVALIWLTQSLRFVELVVNRGLSFRVFFQLTSLLIPNFVAVILPITTFVVVQFVYQRLAGDRELTVMRAAGLSQVALARPALLLAAFAMASCFLLNIWVVPSAFTEFRQYQFEIRNRLAAFLLQEGVFTPVSDTLTVYVRARDRDGTLHGIMVDDARDKNSHATIFAKRGRLIASDGPPRVLLIDGSREEIDRQTGRLNVLTFAENSIDLTQSGKGEATRLRDPTEMSIEELLHPAPGIVPDHDLPKLTVEANRRLSTPFTALGFTMVALVASLTGSFRRHGGLIRPLVAVLAVVALLALQLAVTNLAARNTALVPLIWVEALLPALVCLWLLFGPQARLVPQILVVRLGAA
ncbi:MAG: LPS export ABC transporter permease LptF [Rhodospirillales bacterium]|nr:LPS export ABC transporter permease LptF [Rhodospirillales bacterium]